MCSSMKMDINLDRTRVNGRLQQARGAISVPGVSLGMGPLATGMGKIMQFQIKGKGRTLMDLNRIMNWTVKPQVRLVPGVVDANGGLVSSTFLALLPSLHARVMGGKDRG